MRCSALPRCWTGSGRTPRNGTPACLHSGAADRATRRCDAVWPGASHPAGRSGQGRPLTRRPALGHDGSATGVELLDHAVGDVQLGTHVDGVLQDQVELVALGDGLDGPVGLVQHGGQLFVAALVQVLAELALTALEVPIHVGELTLATGTVAVGHDRALLLEVLGGGTQAGAEILDLLVATREVLLDLGLGGLGRRRVTHDALGADKADARAGLGHGRSGHGSQADRQRAGQRGPVKRRKAGGLRDGKGHG